MLHNTLNYRPVMVVLAITVMCSLVYLYINTSQETAPAEDQGFFIVFSTAPQYATINYTDTYTKQFEDIYKKDATNCPHVNVSLLFMLLLLIRQVSWWYSYHTRCLFSQFYGSHRYPHGWSRWGFVLRGTLKPSLVFYISYHHSDLCSGIQSL